MKKDYLIPEIKMQTFIVALPCTVSPPKIKRTDDEEVDEEEEALINIRNSENVDGGTISLW